MPTFQDDVSSQATFKRLKRLCVPLLENSVLSPTSLPTVSRLLSELSAILQGVQSSGEALKPSIVSYIFFPLSSILRRNPLSSVSDQVLEKIFIILNILCESWWWNFDETMWEQVFLLCGAVLGGIDSKGKGKMRDDETKQAASTCLWTLLRIRSPDEDPFGSAQPLRSERLAHRFQAHARTSTFIPVLGQTIDSLLVAAQSSHSSLQRSSLRVLYILIEDYLPDNFVPSILPGVFSTTSKIALATGVSKGWANGDIVSEALRVMQSVIVRSVGNDICCRDGAVKGYHDLEDLVHIVDLDEHGSNRRAGGPPYATDRTSAWLRGTASQLHIGINALTSLVNHPNPSALIALATFSETVLSETTLTVPQSQSILLSFLLALSRSDFDSVSAKASSALRQLLTLPSSARFTIMQVLMQISKDNLAALPRAIVTHADAKVEHIAGILESICLLATAQGRGQRGISPIASGVGKLLGPNGGIEKWGWNLLSVLEFVDGPLLFLGPPTAPYMLEGNAADLDSIPFPGIGLRHITSRSALMALERMLRAMGKAAREDCIFAIDWFMSVGQSGRGTRAVAALWCTCRLIEGISDINLSDKDSIRVRPLTSTSKRVDRLARGIARRVSEFWANIDSVDEVDQEHVTTVQGDEEELMVEHVKGIVTVRITPDSEPRSAPLGDSSKVSLHRALSLQVLAVTAGILEARFTTLLLHTLYPVLHSLVSEVALVSSTALATLYFISRNASYASPANMLLSNFDYALDAVSRRLTRRWLDVDATKILAVLVRIVGHDVVQKAGDVVEECFDRLDDYHGYENVVDGLVEVLTEVVRVVEDDGRNRSTKVQEARHMCVPKSDVINMEAFATWLAHRCDHPERQEGYCGDASYPRRAWGMESLEDEQHADTAPEADLNADSQITSTQTLTKQIVSRSMYFLTHSSPLIRARILMLLGSSVPVLPESALLPSIHQAWPFILNRLSDQESFVVSAAASLVESLATHVGDFMYRRAGHGRGRHRIGVYTLTSTLSICIEDDDGGRGRCPDPRPSDMGGNPLV
ncbi:uncharacterized protein FIBRA_06359 [Fibroporia radiculosa]|uniref:TEL2-interacting protein 1 n=1 Tax=Fibroporia radiculosa TaxID=599839 RepID=J4GB89_9APHY|nr:uncharacterized protein FIBRA_06359 [Fibroporia radiculosa]CCM04193.1 predicted protein [Fibroporia radiculosa]